MADEAKPNPLVLALAAHFEIDPYDILNYAVIVKHVTDDKEIYSSAWPENVHADTLLGAVSTLNVHAERLVG